MTINTPLGNHKHFILKGTITKAPLTANAAGLALMDIVKTIGMKIAVGPIAYYCTDEGNRGMTAMAIIETSHVVLHVWDETDPAQIQFDLYSCQDFEEEMVVSVLEQHFGDIHAETVTLGRNFGEPLIFATEEK